MARKQQLVTLPAFSQGLRAIATLFLLAGGIFCWRKTWALASAGSQHWEAVFSDTRPLIFLDAGHGGVDGGTQGGGLLEKDLALDTTLRLARALQARGQRVAMTREADQTVSLEDRVAVANERQCALFVSVHFDNAGRPGAKAHGFEALYTSPKSLGASVVMARRFGLGLDAEALAEPSIRLGSCVHQSVVERLKIPGRGVRPQNLAVCRETHCPAVLLEGGFLSSEEDLERLRDAGQRTQLAEAIAEGIMRYLHPLHPQQP